MLEDASIRQYFIRAIYQWCIDQVYTPYLLVEWAENNQSQIPQHLVTEGKIVLNISPESVRKLTIDSDFIHFTARFLGKTAEVKIALAEVLSIYASEIENGISFPPLPQEEREALPADADKNTQTRKKIEVADIQII